MTQRVFRVDWQDGIPFIRCGRIVTTGKDGRSARCKFNGDKKLSPRGHGSLTMKEAIAKAIEDFAHRCCPIFSSQGQPKPWVLARIVGKLMRLRRKLERHHLI